MPLTTGARLGPYEIAGPLGAGGMGEVYRARDTRLDRDVALKILPEAFASDADRRARFEREGKAVASLSHPNILAIFDVGEAGGVVYAATELLEGQTLRERLQNGPLPARKAVDFAVQIARGLASAHDRGIVHRDLKPENLFLVGDGQVKILDFGLARQTTPSTGSGATQTIAATDPGTVLGTVGYMAPEQVRGQNVDGRADLFSLGAVLYEMVTGQRAFHRHTAADTLSAILREDPPEASGSRPDLPPALDRIIRHALEKEPDERFQTARDVAFALTSLSGSSSGVPAAATVASGRRRIAGWLVAAGVAIAAALGGVVAGRAMVTAPPAPAFAPLTFDDRTIYNARFMPDGQTIIFSSSETGGNASLFELRPGGIPRGFAPARTHLLSISKSGELAVLANATFQDHRLFRGTLARMTLDGAPRVLASDVREADWLPDGTDLVVIREVAGGDHLEFPIGKIVYKTAGTLSDPRVSPDGTRVAFMEHPELFDDRGHVKVVDRSGAVTTLAGEYWGEEGVAWSPDGKSVLHAGAPDTDYIVYTGPADGGRPPSVLLRVPGSFYVHDIAADGRILVTQEDARFGIVVRGAGQEGARDLTILDQSWYPDLSPDGRFVAFSDGRSGADYSVLTRSVDGAPPVRLGPGNIRGISPDGQWVLANIYSTGQCVAYPTGVGAKVQIDLGPLARCTSAQWFPDSKSVLLVGNEPGKLQRVYRAGFPRGAPEPLLPEGADTPLVSADGKRVLARAPDRTWQRWEIGGASTAVKGLLPQDVPLHWLADDRTVVVANHQGSPGPVFRVDLVTGARTKVAEYAPAGRVGLLFVRPRVYRDDGRQYTYDFNLRVSKLFLVRGAQ